MGKTENFYVTFGQQYRHRGHPTWKPAHPDGWVRIEAADQFEATEAANRWFGPDWSMLYPLADFNEIRHHYPKGELGVATIQTITKSQTSDATTGE